MRMEVYLEAFGLWDDIIGTGIQRKKDCLALSVIFRALSEDFLVQLDPITSAKENLENL